MLASGEGAGSPACFLAASATRASASASPSAFGSKGGRHSGHFQSSRSLFGFLGPFFPVPHTLQRVMAEGTWLAPESTRESAAAATSSTAASDAASEGSTTGGSADAQHGCAGACSACAGAADARDGASAAVGAASGELALRLAERQLAVALPLPELGILGTGMLTAPGGKLLAIISDAMVATRAASIRACSSAWAAASSIASETMPWVASMAGSPAIGPIATVSGT